MNAVVAGGTGADYDFAIAILENYQGEVPTHTVLKDLLDRLPDDDPRLVKLELCLIQTGVVTGEFGWVDTYRARKDEIRPWLEDSRLKVRRFAAQYISGMDQRIAQEQRNAEMERELRLREYGEEQ